MSSVAPSIRAKFDSMPPELQQAVLSMDVQLETMNDLMSCLERIIAEGENCLLYTSPSPRDRG